jgi:hypothetical protein
MCAFVVQKSAMGACDHQGTAQPTVTSPRVSVGGQPIVLAPATYTVAGCPFSNASGPIPCATVLFPQGAVRVKSMGQPVLLSNATGIASGPLPVQGSGALRAVQTRVQAQ